MTTAYPPPGIAPPPQHDPEALEDEQRFQNVDLEQRAASSYTKEPLPPQPPFAQPSAMSTSTISADGSHHRAGMAQNNGGSGSAQHGRIILDSIVNPFGGMKFRDQVALLGVFSLIVMIQSSINCADGVYQCLELNGWAVAFSVFSLFFCMLVLFLEFSEVFNDQQRAGISLLFFLWWTSGMISLTFFAPYNSLAYANGYFGTWGGFFIATIMMANTSETFRNGLEYVSTGMSRRPAFYILLASIIEVGSAIRPCTPQSQCYNLNAFAIALGTVSAALCIILLLFINRMSAMQIRNAAIFFCLWWIVGGLIVTFGGPFVALGNGYFSVAFAIIASFYLLQTYDGRFFISARSGSATAGSVPPTQNAPGTAV